MQGLPSSRRVLRSFGRMVWYGSVVLISGNDMRWFLLGHSKLAMEK